MQFIDLKTQQQRIRNKIEENIRTVLDHGNYIMGPEIKKLEDTLAKYVEADHAILRFRNRRPSDGVNGIQYRTWLHPFKE